MLSRFQFFNIFLEHFRWSSPPSKVKVTSSVQCAHVFVFVLLCKKITKNALIPHPPYNFFINFVQLFFLDVLFFVSLFCQL